MGEDSLKLNLKEIKHDLQKAILECSQRGLMHSTKWLSELNFALREIKFDPADISMQTAADVDCEAEHYLLGKSYFDLKEYDRCFAEILWSHEGEGLFLYETPENIVWCHQIGTSCRSKGAGEDALARKVIFRCAHFTEFCITPRTRFLHLYSRYLSGEKKKIDDMTDMATAPDSTYNTSLQELGYELMKDYRAGKLDGFGLYLYGIVMKRLDLSKEAVEILVEATHKEPMHWGAWLELATLITDKTKLNSLVLPDHWIKQFFLGHTFLEQQLTEDALEIYWTLQQQGFDKSTYLIAQTAIAFHNRREVDMAINTFRRLQNCDPYRLDNLDTYSNLLYVKGLRVDLAHLAHQACEIDKYRVETCCVVGNYYSLRSEHQKAVLYFQRALKLNPQYLSAWTLMGHEYMEMKNTNAAIQSYRQAIEVNRRDYRAWYGLGQTYEILKMFFYCLYYYKQAQHLRPNDSRMLIALGETYEKLDKVEASLKCYFKARSVGDVEGVALLKLAKLYDKLNEFEHAANAFTEFVTENESHQEKSELSQAYKYLANYFVKSNRIDEAYQYAQRCLEYEETKEEGKALLRTIAQKRNQEEENDMQIEEDSSIIRVRPRLADGTPNNQLSPMNLSFSI